MKREFIPQIKNQENESFAFKVEFVVKTSNGHTTSHKIISSNENVAFFKGNKKRNENLFMDERILKGEFMCGYL